MPANVTNIAKVAAASTPNLTASVKASESESIAQKKKLIKLPSSEIQSKWQENCRFHRMFYKNMLFDQVLQLIAQVIDLLSFSIS